MIMMMMMMMMMMMIISFKGAIRDFTVSSLRLELSPTGTFKWPGRNRVQITWNTSSAYHVQPAACHLARRDSSAIKFVGVEIAFILALFYWLKPLTDEGLIGQADLHKNNNDNNSNDNSNNHQHHQNVSSTGIQATLILQLWDM